MRVTTGPTMAGTVPTVLTTGGSVIPIIIRMVVMVPMVPTVTGKDRTTDLVIPIIIRIVVMVPMVTGKDRTTDSHLYMGITTGHGPSEKRVWDGSTWQTAISSEQRRDFPDY